MAAWRTTAVAFRCSIVVSLAWPPCPAWAQSAPNAPPEPGLFDTGRQLFAADPTRKARPADGLSARPGREPGPVPVGDWLAYPVMDAGILYDDNLYGSRVDRVGDVALRLRPRLVATHDTGIQTTALYGAADARLFKDNARADAITGTLGGRHRWEVTRDLVLRFQGEYDRRADDYGQALASAALRGALIPPPQYDQTYLSASVKKDFGALFAGIGASYGTTRFDAGRAGAGPRFDQRYRDETETRLVGRIGYTISPSLYAFLEPSLLWQGYRTAAFDGTGRRVVGGLGSERFGLFSGEIFAGYQAEDLRGPTLVPADGTVFGGRVSWFPTRDVTVTSILERSLGTSILAPGFARLNAGAGLEAGFGSNTLAPPQATVSRTTSAGLQASVELGRALSADAAAAYETSRYADLESRTVSAQIGLRYAVRRDLGLRADYAYTKESAGETMFTRNRVTLGLSAAW